MLQKVLRLTLLAMLITAPNFSPEAQAFWQQAIHRLNALLP